jgi:ArsR family transcriptional regulator
MTHLGNRPYETDIQTLIPRLKALADPNRLRIFLLLMDGVQCNCELGDALEMPSNLISHHLRVLREAGLVNVERDPVDARWIYYSIDPTALADFTRTFGTLFDPSRIKERLPACGPQKAEVKFVETATSV